MHKQKFGFFFLDFICARERIEEKEAKKWEKVDLKEIMASQGLRLKSGCLFALTCLFLSQNRAALFSAAAAAARN